MKIIRIQTKHIALLIGVIALLVASLALAGGGPNQLRSLTAGGGSLTSNGALTLASALGQPVAGSVGEGDLIGASGFWVGAGVQPTPPSGANHFIFLPTVIR